MKKIVKLINIPILVLGIFISLLLSYVNYKRIVETEQYKALMIAGTAMNNFRFTMYDYVDMSDTMQMIVQETAGDIKDLEPLIQKEQGSKPAIKSVQVIKKDGEHVAYPKQSFDQGILDGMSEEEKSELLIARTNGKCYLSQPFQWTDGKLVLAVVTPLYTDVKDKEDTYWGDNIIIVDVDEVMETAKLSVMDQLNYDYRLVMHTNDKKDRPVMMQSGEMNKDMVSLSVKVEEREYDLEMSDKGHWIDWSQIVMSFLFMFALTLIVSISRGYVTSYQTMNEQLQSMNSKLVNVANKDALTGIFNRRGGEQKIQEVLAQKNVREVLLVEMDLDKFKNINDTYGHDAGDLALRQLVMDLRQAFGNKKVFVRNGGDEFIILSYNEERQSFEDKLENFASSKHFFDYDGERIAFSVSCGYAEFPEQGADLNELIKCADDALYHVKEHGRRGHAKYVAEVMTSEREA